MQETRGGLTHPSGSYSYQLPLFIRFPAGTPLALFIRGRGPALGPIAMLPAIGHAARRGNGAGGAGMPQGMTSQSTAQRRQVGKSLKGMESMSRRSSGSPSLGQRLTPSDRSHKYSRLKVRLSDDPERLWWQQQKHDDLFKELLVNNLLNAYNKQVTAVQICQPTSTSVSCLHICQPLTTIVNLL